MLTLHLLECGKTVNYMCYKVVEEKLTWKKIKPLNSPS